MVMIMMMIIIIISTVFYVIACKKKHVTDGLYWPKTACINLGNSSMGPHNFEAANIKREQKHKDNLFSSFLV
jgi:hypothetical protein